MKKMRSIIAVLLAAVMMFSMAACGTKNNGADNNTADSENEAVSETKISADAVVLKIASQGAEGSREIETLKQFADLVNERTNGEIDVQVFPNGQLGALNDTLEGVSMGTIEMVATGMANLQQLSPDFAAYDMWLYEDVQDVIDVYNSDIGKELNQKLIDNSGVRVLSYMACTSGRMYLWSTKPIQKMSDLDGLIIRTPSDKSISTALGAIGSTSVIGFGDMYTAAQTGVIDVGSADISTMLNAGFDEVFPYCDEMTKNFMTMSLVMSDRAYNSLTEEQQKIIDEAAVEACQQWDSKQDELAAETEELLANSKSEFISMEPEELAKMDEKIHEAINAYLSGVIDEDMLKEIQKITSEN